MSGNWNTVALHISKTCNQLVNIKTSIAETGGCINQCWKLTDTNNKNWFVKTSSPTHKDMFIAEAEGLDEIANSKSIRSPNSICHGTTEKFSYLVLEFISLRELSDMEKMGEQLAKMHQTTSQSYGWKRNNTIGLTPQSNQIHNDWVSFWKTERLGYQLNLALKNGYPKKSYDNGLKLLENTSLFFTRYDPKPSLLHGDLWGGNAASDLNGSPVVFDPAVYYGDRETDIAITELFGGFNSNFYSSYNQYYPLDNDYKTRKKLYNLYHILNHFNLFRGTYATQASDITLRLLGEL